MIALLGDVLRAGPLHALIGDTARGVPPRASNPRDIAWRGSQTIELAVELRIPEELPNEGRYAHARYEIGIDVGAEAESLSLSHETLYLVPERPMPEPKEPKSFPRTVSVPTTLQERQYKGWRTVVKKTPSGNDHFKGESSNWNNQFRLGPNRSALANLPEDETKFPIAIWVRRVFLEGTQTRRPRCGGDAARKPARISHPLPS